tara:strand:+ start:242 stop:1735 length:1494 start_codon:yes stop_codon:yes gene_type:complete
MSIIFTPRSGTQIEIGGGTGADIPGPFPRYSISREDITLEDGTLLNTKYNISVAGNITAAGSYTSEGTRQNELKALIKTLMQISTEIPFSEVGIGILEISGYGGGVPIKFKDAKVVSIDALEQSEASGGIHYQEYALRFEAYESAGTTFTYSLTSVNESWELGQSDQPTYDSDQYENAPKRSLTLTHTVSAVGLPDATSNNDYAWNEAQKYVKARLVDDPLAMTLEPLEGLSGPDDPTLKDLLTTEGYTPDDFQATNHVRSINSNITTGEYAVTDTWLLININASSATIDIEFNFELGEETGSFVTATAAGTITGLSSISPTATDDNKMTNAETAWTTVESNLFTLTKNEFENSGGSADQPLKNVELTKNVGKNKNTGTITFSITYNNINPQLAGAISESIQEDFSGGAEVVAIIGVILKATGPVIQDMGTITEKRKSVTLTAKIKKDKRNQIPNGEAVVDTYQPSADNSGPWSDSKQESWNRYTGDYTFTKEWVYT